MGLVDKLLCFGLFGELIVTWNAMSYLTAIKDYKGILLSFSAALVVSFVVWIFIAYHRYATYRSIDDCSLCRLWDHASMGRGAFVPVFSI